MWMMRVDEVDGALDLQFAFDKGDTRDREVGKGKNKSSNSWRAEGVER